MFDNYNTFSLGVNKVRLEDSILVFCGIIHAKKFVRSVPTLLRLDSGEQLKK